MVGGCGRVNEAEVGGFDEAEVSGCEYYGWCCGERWVSQILEMLRRCGMWLGAQSDRLKLGGAAAGKRARRNEAGGIHSGRPTKEILALLTNNILALSHQHLPESRERLLESINIAA